MSDQEGSLQLLDTQAVLYGRGRNFRRRAASWRGRGRYRWHDRLLPTARWAEQRQATRFPQRLPHACWRSVPAQPDGRRSRPWQGSQLCLSRLQRHLFPVRFNSRQELPGRPSRPDLLPFLLGRSEWRFRRSQIPHALPYRPTRQRLLSRITPRASDLHLL